MSATVYINHCCLDGDAGSPTYQIQILSLDVDCEGRIYRRLAAIIGCALFVFQAIEYALAIDRNLFDAAVVFIDLITAEAYVFYRFVKSLCRTVYSILID